MTAVSSQKPVPSRQSETIEQRLPSVCRYGGRDIMTTLSLRRSVREYADRRLDPQVLSDLLWAACGINGKDAGERTVPYWRHRMVIDVYAAMGSGVWLYEPDSHSLVRRLAADIRAQTGLQDFVATAPLNLIYVAHGERMSELSLPDRRLYASVDAAFIGQNVYLYCASQGLATVFRGAVDTEALARTLNLDPEQLVTFAQSVGYPGA